MCRVEFDEKDKELLIQRTVKRHMMDGPQVGDFVLMPGEYNPRRFTHDWGDSIQTTVSEEKRKDGTVHPCAGDVSFYMDRDGECNFSGSLDHAIPKDKIRPQQYTSWREGKQVKVQGLKYGAVWFFHHDQPGAHRGVYSRIEFKVWEYFP